MRRKTGHVIHMVGGISPNLDPEELLGCNVRSRDATGRNATTESLDPLDQAEAKLQRYERPLGPRTRKDEDDEDEGSDGDDWPDPDELYF
jgi:hypothetical protein